MDTNIVHHPERPAGAVKSAVRVLDLLEFLAVTATPAGVSEIARRLELPKSSTHMLLATLEGRGYVQGDAERRFRLHAAFTGAGRSWVGGFRGPLLRVAPPIMRKLARLTGESVFLGVMRGDNRLEYIEKVVSTQDVRSDAELGVARFLHSTSTGLVLLAGNPAQAEALLEEGHLERCTPNTICDAKRLRREIAAVAKAGYAMVSDTNSPHASGVAAPVRDASGKVIAALNVAAPTGRFSALEAAATEAVVRAARQISRELAGSAAAPGEA